MNTDKKSLIFLATIVMLCLMTSCAKIYKSPDVSIQAKQHQRIAIIPSKVSIRKRKPKPKELEVIKRREKAASINYQIKMQDWLLKRKTKNQILVEVQDLETTNVKLREAGYFEGKQFSSSEICKLLGVDAIITSNYILSQPVSEDVARMLDDCETITNEVLTNLSIFDGKKEKIIWSYKRRLLGTLGSSRDRMVSSIVKNASKRMPY